MAVFIVTYDLNTPGQKYDCLTEKLEAYGIHWHMQGSVWLIVTTQTAVEIRDNLQECLDSNDELFVARLSGEAAWTGYGKNITEWLKKYL